MSGHSKWSNIKRKKEASDAAKGAVFTKFAKEIAVAVKAGGPDPNSNSRLKVVVAKAKAANMPNDNINRAIKKAAEAGEGRYIVGVDIDQSGLSDRVLTSAMKSLVNTISNAVAASFGDGDWNQYCNGLYTADATSGGVAIAETFDKFEGFTAEDYETLKADLAAGKYQARTDKDVEGGDPTTVDFTYVVVDYKK